MNYYRNYHIFNEELETNDIFDNIELSDKDEFTQYLIPESSISEFWNVEAQFIEIFKSYVYSWACRLGKIIRLKYQKNDATLINPKKLEKPKDRTAKLQQNNRMKKKINIK